MLRVKSFAITDDEGINKLLDTNRIGKGIGILVSNGNICIGYEDGQPETKEQRIAAIGEQKNTMQNELDIIEHSQSVLDLLIADCQDRVNVAQANVNTLEKSETYVKADDKKAAADKLAEAQGAYDQLDNQRRMNAAEITRTNINLAKFDEQIAKLS